MKKKSKFRLYLDQNCIDQRFGQATKLFRESNCYDDAVKADNMFEKLDRKVSEFEFFKKLYDLCNEYGINFFTEELLEDCEIGVCALDKKVSLEEFLDRVTYYDKKLYRKNDDD